MLTGPLWLQSNWSKNVSFQKGWRSRGFQEEQRELERTINSSKFSRLFFPGSHVGRSSTCHVLLGRWVFHRVENSGVGREGAGWGVLVIGVLCIMFHHFGIFWLEKTAQRGFHRSQIVCNMTSLLSWVAHNHTEVSYADFNQGLSLMAGTFVFLSMSFTSLFHSFLIHFSFISPPFFFLLDEFLVFSPTCWCPGNLSLAETRLSCGSSSLMPPSVSGFLGSSFT